MITNASSARERVRLILDRADSPWLTDSEINGFIEASITEYIRERTNVYGGNQKVRDDFGKFVHSVSFSNEPTGAVDLESVFRRQFVNFDATGVYDNSPNINLEHDYAGGEWGINASSNAAAGVGCQIVDSGDGVEDTLFFGTLLEIKVLQGVNIKQCKVMSVDDALSASKDPFNQPGSFSEYHAIRIENTYWVRPGAVSTTMQVVITYISNNNNVENINWLPVHGREEVCQIASRKILGTVADERQPAVDNEIKQLEGK
tara:strand:+ start:5774 stop:6553 length:780 start_codon:yes stop_codon:yes gene_type:complete